jgi:hypothetical protein
MYDSRSNPSENVVMVARTFGPIAVALFLIYLVCNWSQRDMLSDAANLWAFTGLVLMCAFWDFGRIEVIECIIGAYLIYDLGLVAINELKLPNLLISIALVGVGIIRLRELFAWQQQGLQLGGSVYLRSSTFSLVVPQAHDEAASAPTQLATVKNSENDPIAQNASAEAEGQPSSRSTS